MQFCSLLIFLLGKRCRGLFHMHRPSRSPSFIYIKKTQVRELPEYHIVSSSPFLCESGQLKNVSLMLIAKTQTQRQREKNTARNVVGWMVVKRQSGIRVLQLTKGTPSLPVFLLHTSLRKPSSHFALVHRAESHIVEVCTPKITIYRCGGGTGWHLKIWMPEDTPK